MKRIMELSDLTEEDLRELFEILNTSHQDVVISALDKLAKNKTERKNQSSLETPHLVKEEELLSPSDGFQTTEDNANDKHMEALSSHNEPDTVVLNAPKEGMISCDNNEQASSAGCYMFYDADSCKLMLQYSKSAVPGALGFYAPGAGHSIQEFKFKRNCGRVELIGNCASGVSGRKNYYSGWCQFIRAAKAVQGELWIYPRLDGAQGLDVDIYVFIHSGAINTFLLPENCPCQVANVEAVACLPQNAEFFTDVKVDLNRWMTEGSTVGSATRFDDITTTTTTTTTSSSSSLLFSKPNVTTLHPASTPPPKTHAASHQKIYTPKLTPSTPVMPQTPQTPCGGEDRKGCYLIYDADSCKLMLYYSKVDVPGALGFYSPGPGHKIPEFKFKRNFGRTELIGNCASGVAGRKNYYSGWCQFVRAAKAVKGALWTYHRQEGQQGLDVDVFVYSSLGDQQTLRLTEDNVHDVTTVDAVACLPKNAEFFEGLNVDLNRWLTEASTIGAASRFEG